MKKSVSGIPLTFSFNPQGRKRDEEVGLTREDVIPPDHVLRKYGLKQWHVMERLERCGYKCEACGAPFSQYRMEIDHDHGTGEVRGLLCAPCNTAIAFAYDDVQRLRGCAEYLFLREVEAKTVSVDMRAPKKRGRRRKIYTDADLRLYTVIFAQEFIGTLEEIPREDLMKWCRDNGMSVRTAKSYITLLKYMGVATKKNILVKRKRGYVREYGFKIDQERIRQLEKTLAGESKAFSRKQ